MADGEGCVGGHAMEVKPMAAGERSLALPPAFATQSHRLPLLCLHFHIYKMGTYAWGCCEHYLI
jgi:hypothetical protein